jgi:uncharacterized protein YgbK (DUF1537 family)
MVMAHEGKTRVLIVADDLTGSLDTAGPFAQQGLTTMVVAQPLDSDADAVSDARVVSINTDSRHLQADAAADRVERCVRHFSRQRFDIVFKKIDSTLRGNVATETLALMNACDRKHALIAPAFPAQGRTVVDGIVHVDGVPLGKTGFASDALSPPPLKPLGALFAEYVGAQRVGRWRHDEPLRFPDEGVVVADADSDEDMSELYSKVSAIAVQTLLVGSAGLGLTLARNLQVAPVALQAQASDFAKSFESVSLEPVVFVVGSRAARSREQVEQIRAHANTVVLEAPNGILASIPCLGTARQIVLLAVADPLAGDADSVEVARRLARAGLNVADDIGAGAIVVTGGDTAIAVLEASKCAVIDVGGNLMAGIPYARFRHDGRAILLVTKAGGFGTRDTLVDIVHCLRNDALADSRLSTTK